ncbi:MAG TPA: hypothetical protein VJN18_06150 [Polyangiaceae bacterium]|nr:hypothetical protein [Polyangiaceae bacterium]
MKPWMRALKITGIGLALAYVFPTACGSGGVVGGECKPGNCDGTGASSTSGRAGSGGTENAGGVNGEAGEGSIDRGGNGELPDGGFFDSPVDGESDAMAPLECLPPHDSPSHCGDCDTQCVDPTPLCAPDGNGSFECVPRCMAPLVECQGQCVDPASFQSNPDNCGSCGNACPSDICQDGECVGARYGNVALICSDLNSANASSSLTTLIGNAVFLSATNPVSVLAYTRGASAAAVNRVNQVITWAGSARGRSADITEARTVSAVTSNLNVDDYQVLLIHDLDQAGPTDPGAAATTWESDNVLTSFARAGGTIIVLDGADGTAAMHELITNGNLLAVDGQTEITGDQVWNQAPFDVLGANVLSPFLGTSHTCTFDTNVTSDNETIFVLTDDEAGGAPIAIHRVIAP